MTVRRSDGDEGFETELDASRDRLSRPLFRLFGACAPGARWWLVLGLVTSVLAYRVLVTPVVPGTTIDAVFAGEGAYTLPLVPGAWLLTETAEQFRLPAAVVGGALLGGADR